MFAAGGDTKALFDRYYWSKADFRNGTEQFHALCARNFAAPGGPLLSGPVFAAPYYTRGDASDAPYTYALDATR